MGGNRILLMCIVSAAVTVVCSELDEKTVKRHSESDEHMSSKYYTGKHTQQSAIDTSNRQHYSKSFNSGSESKRETANNAKYTKEKTDDYSEDKEEKQYDTDNTGKGKDKYWGKDDGGDYKGDFDGGEDNDNGGKKGYSDDDNNDMGYSKDTYTQTDNSPDVTCSYGVKFLAHPYECTKFYQCAHLKPFLFTCPSGLYFNTNLEVCDWPSNVDCSDDTGESSYKTSYKTSGKSKQGPSYQSSHGADDNEGHEYNIKSTSYSHPRVMTSHKSTSTMYENRDVRKQDTNHQSKVYTDSHSFKDSSKYKKNYHSMSSQKPLYNYPLRSPYEHMMAPYLPVSAFHFPMVPVIQSPIYQPFLPLHAGHSQSPVFQLKKVDDDVKSAGDQAFKETTVDKDSKKQDDSTYQIKKTESSESKSQTSHSSTVNTDNDGKTHVQTVKKVIIKKSRPLFKQDVSGKDKADDTSSKRFYYYYYEDDTQDKDKKIKDPGIIKDENKNTYYYYIDGSKGDSYKDKRQLNDYDNKYDYYYGNNYDYNYEDSKRGHGRSHVQHLVSVDNKYNNNNNNNFYPLKTIPERTPRREEHKLPVQFPTKVKGIFDKEEQNSVQRRTATLSFLDEESVNCVYTDGSAQNAVNNGRAGVYIRGKYLKSSANYKQANEMSDEELGVIHFNHMGRGSKTKAKGEGLGDIGSLLPLLLLGGANGGQQLLITSLLLSGFKNGGSGKGGQTKGKDGKDDLIKQLVLLSLLNGNGNNGNNNVPTVNVPNVQILNGQFVNLGTGQPALLIDPATGQQVTPAQVSVNPTTGQLIVTATGSPVFLQDPATGNLQPAIVGNMLTLQGNPLLPVATRRRPGRRVNFGANMNNINNRFIPLAPTLANQNAAASTSGRDAVNLIFLSPLTPSSLPPPINNDGSATLIRGSLRDILGPNLANFISNVPLVPGQGPPNSAAGSTQSCNVVRSGETVPFRISPRGGRLLPSECDAIGKLLDKFVPTFLQNFVPSDAAFAGFGSSNNNRNGNNSQQTVTTRPNTNDSPAAGGSNVSSGSSSNVIGSGSINDFINVRNDHNGCTIAVPNIVSQC